MARTQIGTVIGVLDYQGRSERLLHTFHDFFTMSVAPVIGTQHKVMSGKKRIMVCGGAGFIGCHLCRRLLSMVRNLPVPLTLRDTKSFASTTFSPALATTFAICLAM